MTFPITVQYACLSEDKAEFCKIYYYKKRVENFALSYDHEIHIFILYIVGLSSPSLSLT